MVDFIEKQEIYRLSNENTQKEQQQQQTKEAKKKIYFGNNSICDEM